MLEFQGSSLLRHHIVFSLLSKRPIRITHIHDGEDPSIPTPQERSEGSQAFFNSDSSPAGNRVSSASTGPAIGLKVHEVNFLKLIARLTSGTVMSTADQNTTLVFQPGMIIGGTFSHSLPAASAQEAEDGSELSGYQRSSGRISFSESTTQRSVSYLMEAILLLLPFAKYDSRICFEGATQSVWDLSVDTIRTVTLRWLQLFGVTSQLRVIRRGAPPGGGGAVELEVRSVRRLKSVRISPGLSSSSEAKENALGALSKANVSHRGRVRRVRGIAFASRTAGDLPQRAATAAKGILLSLLPDVYVVTDTDAAGKKRPTRSSNAEESDDQPPIPAHIRSACSGYGLLLVADTTNSTCLLSQETVARPGEAPEDVGERCARLLLDEVLEGGAVDRHHQLFVLSLMALGPDEISISRLGHRLTPSAVSGLLLLEKYFGVKCAIKSEPSFAGPDLPPSTLVTCMGSNLINVSKKSS